MSSFFFAAAMIFRLGKKTAKTIDSAIYLSYHKTNILMKGLAMEFFEQRDGDKVTYTIKGRIDTNMAPVLAEGLHLVDVKELVFDLKDVDYVFSAGLRVFLQAQKIMNANHGTMKIINVQESVKELFALVGFDGIMDIE